MARNRKRGAERRVIRRERETIDPQLRRKQELVDHLITLPAGEADRLLQAAGLEPTPARWDQLVPDERRDLLAARLGHQRGSTVDALEEATKKALWNELRARHTWKPGEREALEAYLQRSSRSAPIAGKPVPERSTSEPQAPATPVRGSSAPDVPTTALWPGWLSSGPPAQKRSSMPNASTLEADLKEAMASFAAGSRHGGESRRSDPEPSPHRAATAGAVPQASHPEPPTDTASKRSMAEDADSIADLSPGSRAWASQHHDLLELIVQELQATGRWPSPELLTRKLVRLGKVVLVEDVVCGMPRVLGASECDPERVVLSVFGLRCTEAGASLLDGFLQVLRVAIERYRSDEEYPLITPEDVATIADFVGANRRGLREIVEREATFFVDRHDDVPKDVVGAVVGAAVVRYWNVKTPDDYLRQRVSELHANPLFRSEFGSAPGLPAEAPEIRSEEKRDVFISHASKDKAEVARPIAEALSSAGWSVWLDKYELTVGDKLTQSINAGLASSRFGVVILSPAFFDKRWPQEELEGLAAKEAASGSKVILPVWHGIDEQSLAEMAPMLAGRLGVSTAKGIPHVAEELIRALARERRAKVDPERLEHIVRSVEPTGGEPREKESETSGQALPASNAARTWLTRFMGMYEGMDTGPGDPVHDVRMKAQGFLDAGPTDEHPPIICKMIAEALPNDPRAATLEQSWPAAPSTPPSSNAEERRLELLHLGGLLLTELATCGDRILRAQQGNRGWTRNRALPSAAYNNWSRSRVTATESAANEALRRFYVWADATNHRFADGEANEEASIGQVMYGLGLGLEGRDFNDLNTGRSLLTEAENALRATLTAQN